jgi:hypothetical protein
MAGLESFQELVRRSLELNVRYYSAIGRLTTDYVRDLLTTVSEVRAQPSAAQPSPGVTASPMPAPEAVMILEGEAGSSAPGVFLVENNLSQEISACVVASVFTDEAGKQIQPAFKFDPEMINLKPGEQLLVRVEAAIDENLEPEASYYGAFAVPELTGTRIRVVLRRRLVHVKDNSQANAGVKKRSSRRTKTPGSKS